MEGPEPVQRQDHVRIVTLEVLVMKIVGVGVRIEAARAARPNPFEARARCRAQARVHQHHDHERRVEGKQQVEQGAGEVEQVLQRGMVPDHGPGLMLRWWTRCTMG